MAANSTTNHRLVVRQNQICPLVSPGRDAWFGQRRLRLRPLRRGLNSTPGSLSTFADAEGPDPPTHYSSDPPRRILTLFLSRIPPSGGLNLGRPDAANLPGEITPTMAWRGVSFPDPDGITLEVIPALLERCQLSLLLGAYIGRSSSTICVCIEPQLIMPVGRIAPGSCPAPVRPSFG